MGYSVTSRGCLCVPTVPGSVLCDPSALSGRIALLASLVGPLGGFLASGIKRAYGVKDFGNTWVGGRAAGFCAGGAAWLAPFPPENAWLRFWPAAGSGPDSAASLSKRRRRSIGFAARRRWGELSWRGGCWWILSCFRRLGLAKTGRGHRVVDMACRRIGHRSRPCFMSERDGNGLP